MSTDPVFAASSQSQALCPTLYGLLNKYMPGGIVVANQGEAMVCSSQFDPSRGQYHTFVVHSGEYYRVNCPFCNDTRQRLWVNHMFGQPDANGRSMRFLVCCYNEDCLSDQVKWKTFCDSILGFRNKHHRDQATDMAVREGVSVDPTLDIVEMPGDCPPVTSLPPSHKAYQYMVNDRRNSLAVLDHYRVCYCRVVSNSRWATAQDRIIFPVFMHGKLVGWQGRYIGEANWHVTPKYYGLPGMRKRFMLYNYDNAKDKPYVVVTEGATDVHSVGDTAIALLGKHITQYQINMLVATWEHKPIVLLLDPEAVEESRAALNDLANMGTNPIVPVELPPGYDPGDYDGTTLLNIIHGRARDCGITLPLC